jgi:hypothetical protein
VPAAVFDGHDGHLGAIKQAFLFPTSRAVLRHVLYSVRLTYQEIEAEEVVNVFSM